MTKILQARLQQYVNGELPDVHAGFTKGRRTRGQIAKICWIIEKVREFQKISTSGLLTEPKPLTVWITMNSGKFWEMGIPDRLTCLLRNLYSSQDATSRTKHGIADCFQIGNDVCQGCILSYAYLMYMHNTSWETLGCMKHRLELRFQGKISITSDMQMQPPLWQKGKKN